MVTREREKSKEALAVASTVTHFTEIVAARSTERYMYNGPAIRGTRLHVHAKNAPCVTDSSRTYIYKHTCSYAHANARGATRNAFDLKFFYHPAINPRVFWVSLYSSAITIQV